MKRSFGFVTLTGSAQPAFGCLTTAAIAIPTKGSLIFVPVTAANAKLFQAGDRIYVEPGTANQDILLIDSINTTTGVMSCQSEGDAATHAHASGVQIELTIACAVILLTGAPANAAAVYIGSDSTVTNVGGGSAFTALGIGGGSFNEGFPQWNSIRTSDTWMAGSSGDKVGVVAIVV